MKTLAIGCDDAAFGFRDQIVEYLQQKGIQVTDYSSDKRPDNRLYPDVAHELAVAVKEGKHERGILICGTGIGMCIVANKVPGIRAALCHDTFSADRARKSNNAQIITMGARVIGIELAKMILDTWLAADFAGGRSAPKVERINFYDQAEHEVVTG